MSEDNANKKVPPTAAELEMAIRDILDGGDLESMTQRTVREQVSHRKRMGAQTGKSLLST